MFPAENVAHDTGLSATLLSSTLFELSSSSTAGFCTISVSPASNSDFARAAASSLLNSPPSKSDNSLNPRGSSDNALKTGAVPELFDGSDKVMAVDVPELRSIERASVAKVARALWRPGDLQHRPGLPVHQRGLHEHAHRTWSGDLDGRTRTLDGQRLHRAAMAQRQV